MNKVSLISIFVIILSSCAPVLKKDIINKAIPIISLSELKRDPNLYKDKLFILGGIIANTTVTKNGSLIEAVYVPVDSKGYLKEVQYSDGRFLALYSGEKGLLDPLIYQPGRKITVAGKFIETRAGKIDEMDYIFPIFEIEEIYLWRETMSYYTPPPYTEWHYTSPYWWNYPWRRYP